MVLLLTGNVFGKPARAPGFGLYADLTLFETVQNIFVPLVARVV